MAKPLSPEEFERFLTVKEFATKYGVSECTVRVWIRRDGLPHVKLGVLRIPPDAMERMLSVSTSASTK